MLFALFFLVKDPKRSSLVFCTTNAHDFGIITCSDFIKEQRLREGTVFQGRPIDPSSESLHAVALLETISSNDAHYAIVLIKTYARDEVVRRLHLCNDFHLVR
jgi:hypothetical protein